MGESGGHAGGANSISKCVKAGEPGVYLGSRGIPCGWRGERAARNSPGGLISGW